MKQFSVSKNCACSQFKTHLIVCDSPWNRIFNFFFYFSFSVFDFFTKGISPKLTHCTGFLKITFLILLFIIQQPSALAGNWLQ